MPLPTPNLDDLRFQKDLVDETRRRIARYCPEWTDYNLSDPGITLIELFAWMMEQIIYRLNRVPEKNYIKFLELLGVQLKPAVSARAEVTFWLSAPFPLTPDDETQAAVPQNTEVATWETAEEGQVVFTTDEKLVIAAPRLVELRRQEDRYRNYLPQVQRGTGEMYAFDEANPKEGETFFIGLDPLQDISGTILRLTFRCRETEAPGIKRQDPPLIWECSMGNGVWKEVLPSTRRDERDTTGGLNNAVGSIVFYLPLSMRTDEVHGRQAYWLRCRFERRYKGQGMYTQSPRIQGLTAFTLGRTTWASHAVLVNNEVLGYSSGDPGQIFYLQHAPLMALRSGETVEVQEEHNGQAIWMPWQQVNDFSMSGMHDRHFTLDPASGEVAFGPSVRQPEGGARQYGRVPEAGRMIRINRYRRGGGTVGNVSANKLQVLLSAVPYIDQVINLSPADGGRDQETLAEAMLRAQREMRTQQRMVTPQDFEILSRSAPHVARTHCDTTAEGRSDLPPGMVVLLAVPAVADAVRKGDLARLSIDNQMERDLRAFLDRYRLLTTTLDIREPNYLGVRVEARVVPTDIYMAEVVAARVGQYLQHFISPLLLPSDEPVLNAVLGTEWEGWPFGRNLYVSEVYSFIQQVPGVAHVLDVRLYYRSILPRQMLPLDEMSEEERQAQMGRGDDLVVAEQGMILVPPNALLCSLDHRIQAVRTRSEG